MVSVDCSRVTRTVENLPPWALPRSPYLLTPVHEARRRTALLRDASGGGYGPRKTTGVASAGPGSGQGGSPRSPYDPYTQSRRRSPARTAGRPTPGAARVADRRGALARRALTPPTAGEPAAGAGRGADRDREARHRRRKGRKEGGTRGGAKRRRRRRRARTSEPEAEAAAEDEEDRRAPVPLLSNIFRYTLPGPRS